VRAPAAIQTGFVGRAFGIELRANFRVPGVLERSSGRAVNRAGTRHVELQLRDAGVADSDWPAGISERTFELRGSDNNPVFTIDHEPDAGYRVWIAGLGQCVIGSRGDGIVCSPPRGRYRWHLLVGQGLPIAAALQGLEVLHASAVALGSTCAAFVAPSGTGKTSLALHLLAHGAAFLADDVLALEAGGDALLAHPGIGLAHAPQADRRPKRYVTVDLPLAPVPLGAVYFLERTQDVELPEISPVDPPDPILLLGSTFVSHVPTAARLITQLDICSRIARTVPLFRVRAPVDGGPANLAERVAQHLETGA
jgi:HPr kinase/phosphorylase